MKNYKIVINGTAYEVAIEEITAAEATAAPAPVAAAPAPKAAPVTGGESVTAPMPGTVLQLSVADGTAVKAGQVVAVLEAMKMENEIVAPVGGKVTYCVAKGATVQTGDVLCTIA